MQLFFKNSQTIPPAPKSTQVKEHQWRTQWTLGYLAQNASTLEIRFRLLGIGCLPPCLSIQLRRGGDNQRNLAIDPVLSLSCSCFPIRKTNKTNATSPRIMDIIPDITLPATSFSDVDWTSLVDESTAMHVIHGGIEDSHGIYGACSHLQASWNIPIVWARAPAHLQDVLADLQAPKATCPRLLVCTDAGTVAASPATFDALIATKRATMVVAIPVESLPPRAVPYGKSSHVVALVLPSCRANPGGLSNAGKVYGFPGDIRALSDAVCALPHDIGLSWKAAWSTTPSYVSFSLPAKMTPAQGVVQRRFPWAGRALWAPTQAPSVIANIVAPRWCCMPPLQGHGAPIMLTPNRMRFQTGLSDADLRALRSKAAVAATNQDCHIITPENNVFPIRFQLASCIAVGTASDDDDAEAPSLIMEVPFVIPVKEPMVMQLTPTWAEIPEV